MQSLNKKWAFRSPGCLEYIELGYFTSYEEAENELLAQYSDFISAEHVYSDGTQYEIFTV